MHKSMLALTAAVILLAGSVAWKAEAAPGRKGLATSRPFLLSRSDCSGNDCHFVTGGRLRA